MTLAITPPDFLVDAHPLCAETDPEAYFPEKGESAREAKAVCRRCDLRAACLAYALPRPELSGIWGATSAQQRQNLRRRAERPAA